MKTKTDVATSPGATRAFSLDVAAENETLAERVRRIVATASGVSGTQLDEALAVADGDARERLERSERDIASALGIVE